MREWVTWMSVRRILWVGRPASEEALKEEKWLEGFRNKRPMWLTWSEQEGEGLEMNSEGKRAIRSSKALWVTVTALNLTLRNYSVWENKLVTWLVFNKISLVAVLQLDTAGRWAKVETRKGYWSNREKNSNSLDKDSGSGGEKCLHSRYILKVLLTGLVNE